MKKLNVLGIKATVKIKKPDDEKNTAELCRKTNTIVIDPDSDEKFHDMSHELGHLFWDRAGLLQAFENNTKAEEIFAESFANLLNDNIVTLYQTYNKLKKK